MTHYTGGDHAHNRYCYVVSGRAPGTRVMGFIDAPSPQDVEKWVRQAFFERHGYNCSDLQITTGEYNA